MDRLALVRHRRAACLEFVAGRDPVFRPGHVGLGLENGEGAEGRPGTSPATS